MFRKITALMVMTGVALLAPLGCDSGDENDLQPNADAGTADAKADAKADREVPDVIDGGESCYDEAAASGYDPTKVVVAAQKGACTAELAKQGKEACLGSTATGCQAFTDAHPVCAGCLGLAAPNKDANGKAIIPALIPFGESVVPNADACAAVTIKNEETCGLPYVNETTCIITSCANTTCDLKTCATQSADTVCAAALVDPASTCGKAYTAGKATIDAACSGTTFDDSFAKVAAVLCE